MSDWIGFLEDCTRFGGVTFLGNFTMPRDHLRALWYHYEQTGENLLDEYCTVKYMMWDGEPDVEETIDHEMYNNKMSSLSKIRALPILDSETVHNLQRWTKKRLENYIDRKGTERQRKRNNANNYTSNSYTRKLVFKEHGRVCLKCGSDENITLDHVVPVSRGGKNKIDNLQPLCQSCNSKKGSKIEDYR